MKSLGSDEIAANTILKLWWRRLSDPVAVAVDYRSCQPEGDANRRERLFSSRLILAAEPQGDSVENPTQLSVRIKIIDRRSSVVVIAAMAAIAADPKAATAINLACVIPISNTASKPNLVVDPAVRLGTNLRRNTHMPVSMRM